MPSSPERRKAEQYGKDAEIAVSADWRRRGFDVLAQRQRTGAGEIDLVVANDRLLVFIEVKARNNFAAAAYAVAPRQQARLLQAAECLLAVHENWNRETIRFDVALVCHGAIRHIEDAIRYN